MVSSPPLRWRIISKALKTLGFQKPSFQKSSSMCFDAIRCESISMHCFLRWHPIASMNFFETSVSQNPGSSEPSVVIGWCIIKMGARLGGATKELLPNLDTYKNNEKSSIPLRFLFFGGCFGKQICSFLCVRPSVRASVRAAARQDTSRDWRFFGDQKSRIPS